MLDLPRTTQLKVTQESPRQRRWLTKGEQVTAWQLFGVQPQALFGHPALELVREEAIVTAGDDRGRDVWPAVQREGGLEKGVRGWLRHPTTAV